MRPEIILWAPAAEVKSWRDQLASRKRPGDGRLEAAKVSTKAATLATATVTTHGTPNAGALIV
jgi:hypothetical protein